MTDCATGDYVAVQVPRWLAEAEDLNDGEITGTIEAETTKAIMVSMEDEGREQWLPKSQIQVEVLESKSNKFREAQQYKEIPTEELPDVGNTVFEPWEHQKRAYHFLRQLDGVLLDMHMGTGKTKVVVDYISNDEPGRTLVICPKSVIPVWEEQVNQHSTEQIEVVKLDARRGTAPERVKYAKKYHNMYKHTSIPVIYVTNYEIVYRDAFKKWAYSMKWDLVVADEVHRIKAPGGKTSMAMKTLGKKAAKRLGLTGTPMPHSPLDIYAEFRFLDPSIFGTSYNAFKHKYAVFGGYGGHEVIRFKNQREMAQKMEQITFSAGEEVLDLPDEQHIERTFALSEQEMKIYQEIEHLMVAEIEDGEVTAQNALTKLLRLQQITGGFVKNDEGMIKDIGNSKREVLTEMLEDMPDDEPVVVFCRFHPDLDAVKQAATDAGHEYAELSGRQNDLAEWQDGKANILGVQIQAGAEGIDLTRARYGIYYSLGFSLGNYRQSLARINRPGQTRPVVFYHLIAQHTIDRKVYATLQNREDAIDAVLQHLKQKA